MAEELASTVLEKLSHCIFQQSVKLPVANKIYHTLTLVVEKAVIPYVESRQIEREVMLWLEDLKDALYTVDDLLEEWNSVSIQVNRDAGLHNKVRSYLLSPFLRLRSVLVHRDICHRLKGVNRRLDQIASQIDQISPPLTQFQAISLPLAQSQADALRRPRTRPVNDVGGEPMPVGGDVKRAVLQDLLSDIKSNDIYLPIICILGMGGIGKTTLASQIFNDEEVALYFEHRIWVLVSPTLDTRRVCEAILHMVTPLNSLNGFGLEYIFARLTDSLRGKLFLLVLDDVWSEDPSFWNVLKLCLASGATGSRVLVTTRNQDVALKIGSTRIHTLKVFSPDEAWNLFSETAFRGWQETEEFQSIGRRILARCGGLPLAIKTVAVLLNGKQTVHDWERVLGTLEEGIVETGNTISRTLLISYTALPSKLKQCLLYCAIFPNNMEIHGDNIIKLWMAQGYLGSGGTERLEAIGEDYFLYLCQRSFFQTDGIGSDGKILSCRMHNLVLEFVQSFTKRECYSLSKTRDEHSMSTTVRHLTTINMENAAIYSKKYLRTLIRPFDFRRSTFTVPIKLFRQLAHLRALDLSFSSFEELPTKVGELSHLRYLDLSHTSLLKLPETITNLRHLQTLKLNDCRTLSELPEGIGKLGELRHLEIQRTEDLCYLPRGIAKLVFLRTLNKFIVGGASQGCSIESLKHLKHIKGKLKIIGLGKVAQMREAAEAEVQKKMSLNGLTLNFGYLIDGDVKRSESILQSLQPHEYLEELKIKCFPGSEFPSWIGILTNLETLVLSKCENCKELPALGNLQYLRSLTLVEMNLVNSVRLEFYGFDVTSSSTAKMVAFPRLEILKFHGLLDWEEWKLPVSTERNVMPNLRMLSIKDCPKLNSLPPFGKLECLEDLVICNLKSLINIGDEFYGFGNGSESEVITFSKLKKLDISSMEMLDNWEIPFSLGRNIMPFLSELTLSDCPKLKSFPGFGRLESLESLLICNVLSVERIGLEFLGIAGEEMVERVVIFPYLMKLVITGMPMLVDWDMPSEHCTSIMPKLRHLKIENCRKLKRVPHLGGSKTLDSLRLIIG